jgi:hypothetical protein
MIKEHKQHMDRGTWRYVRADSVPSGKVIIPAVWQFKYKFKEGIPTELKSRACGGGHKQKAGEDYGASYAPTTRIANVRTLLSIGTQEGFESEGADIEGAFLYSMLEGEWVKVTTPSIWTPGPEVYEPTYRIYMRCFEGFQEYDTDGHPMVCLILRGMYGLVQAALLWNQRLVLFFQQQNFRQLVTDPCMFQKMGLPTGHHLIVPIHVDDLMPTGKPPILIDEFLTALAGQFKIKRLGPTDWFSGIKIVRQPDISHTSCSPTMPMTSSPSGRCRTLTPALFPCTMARICMQSPMQTLLLKRIIPLKCCPCHPVWVGWLNVPDLT